MFGGYGYGKSYQKLKNHNNTREGLKRSLCLYKKVVNYFETVMILLYSIETFDETSFL